MRYVRLILMMWAVTISIVAVAQEAQTTHTVQSGENLFRIALRYGVDMDTLAAVNQISDVRTVYAGQVLIIPGLQAVDQHDDVSNPLVAAAPVLHTVQQGEYLGQIARRYHVTIQDILSANNISNPDSIYPGQTLQIWTQDIAIAPPPPVTATQVAEIAPTPVPPTEITHIVASGEYLSLIGQRYGVAWTTIAEANNIVNGNTVETGTVLLIPGGDPNAMNRLTTTTLIPPERPAPPAHWGTGREIVVDLSTQMTYAYEDGILLFSALVSTGLPATPTVQGEYAIWHKTQAQTMSGPGYHLPNVQWVMYFYQGYGFHGTYWHNNFGNPMSHGCVNMTNADAQWLYQFGSVGTPVWVQY